jgi:hypothetical protein
MNRFIEVVKQYPGQQQVDLSVEIEVNCQAIGSVAVSQALKNERSTRRRRLSLPRCANFQDHTSNLRRPRTQPSASSASQTLNMTPIHQVIG